MPRKIQTVQGQMWDQLALEWLKDEHNMIDVVSLNPAFTDVLMHGGENPILIPDEASASYQRTLAPWEL